jgi:hypothetical protein
VRAAVRILRAAGVPFALAGRVAVWTYVPPRGQGFTRDVDFAVPYGYGQAIEEELKKEGFEPVTLGIGGLGIERDAVVVDFIDRHPSLSRLYTEAVEKAQANVQRFGEEELEVPVVPKDYLLAMKLVLHETKDEEDAQELMLTMSEEELRAARRLVESHVGAAGVDHLDTLARRIRHPGAEPRYDASGAEGPGRQQDPERGRR